MWIRIKRLSNVTINTKLLNFNMVLKINKDDIVLIDQSNIYKEIYISTSYTHDIDSNLPPKEEIYSFYQSIVKNTKKSIESINIIEM